MKNILFTFLMALGLLACSKEDWFENIQPEINFFAVPEDATGEEADLRRAFFENTGIYLLFNDTLGVRETPTLSGETAKDPQVVNFSWSMTNTNTYPDSLVFDYFQDIAQQTAAAQFLQKEVLPTLPELFYPYSLLLVHSGVLFNNNYGTYDPGVDISVLPALQATAIALGDIVHLNQEEKDNLEAEIIKEIVISRIDLISEEEFAAFYSYSEEYYDAFSWDLPDPFALAGFLDTYYYDWGVTFNSREYDRLAFVEKVFEISEDEFRATYADYPIIINKMEEIVKVLNKYGVNIYQ